MSLVVERAGPPVLLAGAAVAVCCAIAQYFLPAWGVGPAMQGPALAAGVGIYGWMMCAAGTTDRVLLGGPLLVVVGFSAMLWVPVIGVLLGLPGGTGEIPALLIMAGVFCLVTAAIVPGWWLLVWYAVWAGVVLWADGRWMARTTRHGFGATAAAGLHVTAAGALFMQLRIHRGRLRRRGFCACGYPTEGLDADVCPECGDILTAR